MTKNGKKIKKLSTITITGIQNANDSEMRTFKTA